MKTLFGICLLLLLFSACRTPESSLLSEHFNTGKLPTQSFTVNPDVDTTLITSGSVRIHISKGSFEGGKPVTIEWKEALQFKDMLRAGLLTQSGKEILSSGGMFYLNTKEDIVIQKPIEIEVPTNTVVQGMQLYKGDSADGKIDWQEPKPIENIKAFGENVFGKQLFDGNCAQCHRIDKVGTGPALAGITERKSREWLYAVTHNPAAMASVDPYLHCEVCKYHVVMQAFPALSKGALDSLYSYIEDETERLGLTGKISNNSCDSCAIDTSAYDSLLSVYNKLFAEQYLPEEFSIIGKMDSATNQKNDKTGKEKSKDIIQGKDYYQVTIQASGWYNIDILLKENASTINSKLIVKAKGERNQEMEYYLAIPALKILTGGSSYENGDEIVFYNQDGIIPLPQQRQAFIIALGGTNGKYFFSKTSFIISADQTINLPIQKISKQQFDAQLTELSYYGLSSTIITEKAYKENVVPINDSILPPATTNSQYDRPLTKIEKQLQNIASERLKNCGCPSANASKDTSSTLRPAQTTAPTNRAD